MERDTCVKQQARTIFPCFQFHLWSGLGRIVWGPQKDDRDGG